MQPRFSLVAVMGLVLLPVMVMLVEDRLSGLPDRRALPERVVEVRFEPVSVHGVTSAWAVQAGDPRLGGVSALAVKGERLVALTDSGVVISLPKPGGGGQALLQDLPDGPGQPTQKRARDSEALARGTDGSWLVAFENRHSVWRFDGGFGRVLAVRSFRRMGWGMNRGIEAMLALPSGTLLLIPENGRQVVRVAGRERVVERLQGASGSIADAVLLPDGRALVLVREVGLLGIRNRLALLAGGDERGYRLRVLKTFDVGPLTNLEAIAAEPLPSGVTRLWVMSDNDFSTWRRTILLAIDLVPAEAGASGGTGGS